MNEILKLLAELPSEKLTKAQVEYICEALEFVKRQMDEMNGFTEEVKAHMRNGSVIAAIKAHRESAFVSLREAVVAVKTHMNKMGMKDSNGRVVQVPVYD